MHRLADWLSDHMFPCFYQQVLGFHCPFCGLQRSVIALLEGDIGESITLFPPLFPLLLTALFALFYWWKHTPTTRRIINIMLLADAAILLINCIVQNILS
ncbi:MAG: DUF2752 domain-containing protein [Bacteroidales bacterium]|nr:DUF2752 domain-containing protein [Bacteroidales bacterium]